MVEFDKPEKLEEYFHSLANEGGLHTRTLKRLDISPKCGISYSLFPEQTLHGTFDLSSMTHTDLGNIQTYLSFLSGGYIRQANFIAKNAGLELVYVGEDIDQFSNIMRYDPLNTQLLCKIGIGKSSNTTEEQVKSLVELLAHDSSLHKLEELLERNKTNCFPK